jgi:hypothetical protein
MPTTSFSRRSLFELVALSIVLPSISSPTAGAEPFRWKFQAGERLAYNMSHDMTMNMDAGPAGQMVTTVQQTISMTWDVKEVNEAGDAVIQQSVDRVKMSMTGQPGQGFKYDSDADGPPEGMGAMIAPMFDAMTQGVFEVTMTPRGEIRDVKIPPEVLNALKNSPGAAAMGDMATAEGFQKMIMQGAVVLPEQAAAVGDSWSSTATMNNPMTGKQIVETSYTYEGTKDIDGVTMAVFRPTVRMEFEGNSAVQLKISEQQSDGEVLFNEDAGRLDSTSLQQTTKIDMTIAGQTIEQQIEQTVKVKVTPKEATEAGGPTSPK